MDAVSNDTFCSLDMLAEVASATLQNDPTLLANKKVKYNYSSKVNIGSQSRKQSANSEKLTLDQIKLLSEKMLLEMFSELTCDEIRKNYSFKCFLVPDKCSQIFKSFGSEARARCKMKLHLQAHIDELSEENDQICEKFTAEPLHVRRKRLKELNAKSVRRRKRGKQLQYNKKKKDSSAVEYFPTGDCKSKSKKPSSAYKTSNNPLCIFPPTQLENNYDEEFDKYTGVNFDQDLDDTASEFLSGTQEQTGLPIKPIGINGFIEARTSHKTVFNSKSGQKFYSRKKKKKTPSTNSEYVVKWNVDFDDTSLDNSSVVDFEATEYFPESCTPTLHDHTYTSILGNTFHEHNSGEYNKVVSKPLKEGKKSHRCTNLDHPLIIPTPPFPYVYVPILPHIAEIQEIGNDLKPTCNQCTNVYIESSHENSSSSNVFHKKSSKRDRYLENNGLLKLEENESNTEDDENTPSDSCLEDLASESEINSEASDSKIPEANFNVEDVLATDCPENLQSIEKKLALKCIRALRTKKKDERGPLVCQICKNKSFTAQATLMYHYRSHAGIKPFSCTLCEATFTRQHSLNYHMLIHNNKSRFVCTDCGRNFRHPSHYKEHLRRHTGETPYECTDCNLRFKTRNTYKRHLKTRHGKILTAQGIRLLSVEEFYKVRTSPRKKIFSSSLAHEGDQETQWPEDIFSQRDFYL